MRNESAIPLRSPQAICRLVANLISIKFDMIDIICFCVDRHLKKSGHAARTSVATSANVRSTLQYCLSGRDRGEELTSFPPVV